MTSPRPIIPNPNRPAPTQPKPGTPSPIHPDGPTRPPNRPGANTPLNALIDCARAWGKALDGIARLLTGRPVI